MNAPALTHDRLIERIYAILNDTLNHPHLERFSASARLNEDLMIDSIALLQLLIQLELQCGIEVPDESLSVAHVSTVEKLAAHLLNQRAQEDTLEEYDRVFSYDIGPNLEAGEPLDIKVHCVVSCLCHAVKTFTDFDHRPMYFGVWDAPVYVDEQGHLNYHIEEVNHDAFFDGYERLYGVKARSWFDPKADKTSNIMTLFDHLHQKAPTTQLMVMLDMYRLPTRENAFSQNPFPHYVLLEPSNTEGHLFMNDPDFRWEGLQPIDDVVNALESEAVAGGYLFDARALRAPSANAIADHFVHLCKDGITPMSDAVQDVTNRYTHSCDASALYHALRHLPVVAIRKYAYEHAFAFFWHHLCWMESSFEHWCTEIEALVSGYKRIHYLAMKQADTHGEYQAIDEIRLLISDLIAKEQRVKQALHHAYHTWQSVAILSPNTNESEVRPHETL